MPVSGSVSESVHVSCNLDQSVASKEGNLVVSTHLKLGGVFHSPFQPNLLDVLTFLSFPQEYILNINQKKTQGCPVFLTSCQSWVRMRRRQLLHLTPALEVNLCQKRWFLLWSFVNSLKHEWQPWFIKGVRGSNGGESIHSKMVHPWNLFSSRLPSG